MSSFKKAAVSLFVVGAAFGLFSESANAVTFDGAEYTKMLVLKSSRDFGYWPGPDKYFTFRGDDNVVKSIPVASVPYRDDELNGVKFGDVFAMGLTEFDYGPIKSGNVAVTDNKGNNLLTANIIPGGSLTSVLKSGFAGQLSVFGAYETTGGSLASIFGPSIYVDIQFDYVWQNKYKDLKTSHGTWTFYSRTGGGPPSPEVPEPASAALLLSGIAGAKFVRRRKSLRTKE